MGKIQKHHNGREKHFNSIRYRKLGHVNKSTEHKWGVPQKKGRIHIRIDLGISLDDFHHICGDEVIERIQMLLYKASVLQIERYKPPLFSQDVVTHTGWRNFKMFNLITTSIQMSTNRRLFH